MHLYNKLDPGLYVWMYSQEELGQRGSVEIAPLNKPSEGIETQGTKAIFQEAVDKLVATGVCRGSVNPSYIHHFSVRVNNILLILYEIQADKKTVPHGFAVIRYDEDEENGNPGLYIDVICSNQGYGGKLLEHISKYADLVGAYFVGLSSLPTVLTFYPKYGFEFRKSCAGPANAQVPDAITTMKKENYPKTVKNTYKSKPFMDFMLNLHGKDLTVYDEGRCGDKKPISAASFKRHACASDGFSMKKCLRRHTQRRTQTYRNKSRRISHSKMYKKSNSNENM